LIPILTIFLVEAENADTLDEKISTAGDEAHDKFEDDLNLRDVNRRFKPFRDVKSRDDDDDDRRSTFTTSTVASIAPEVIKQRVKVKQKEVILIWRQYHKTNYGRNYFSQ
jgi:hypothetical protein